jgi:hypothetical protein
VSSSQARPAILRPTVTLVDALLPAAVRDRLGGIARDGVLGLRRGIGAIAFYVAIGAIGLPWLAAGALPTAWWIVRRTR